MSGLHVPFRGRCVCSLFHIWRAPILTAPCPHRSCSPYNLSAFFSANILVRGWAQGVPGIDQGIWQVASPPVLPAKSHFPSVAGRPRSLFANRRSIPIPPGPLGRTRNPFNGGADSLKNKNSWLKNKGRDDEFVSRKAWDPIQGCHLG